MMPNQQPKNSKRKKSETRRREEQIKVRVTAEEQERIDANARGCGLSTPEMLRRLGQGYTPQSRLDQLHVKELCTVAADLGRLGGLLKLWLVEKRGGKVSNDKVSIPEVDALWRDIQKTYALVKERVVEL